MSERNRTIALLGALAIVLLILAGMLYSAISRRDVDSFIPMLVGFAVPTITALLTAAGVRSDLSGVKKQVEDVHEQVNGNYSRLADHNERLTTELARAERNVEALATRSVIPAAARDDTPPADDPAAGRHRTDDRNGTDLHLAAPADTITADAVNVAQASTTDRTVSGLVLPWGKTGHTTAGPLSIQRGGVRLPRDLARCKLHFKHTGTEGHRPVGYATGYHVDDDGLHMTFRVARTPDGDAAMVQVTEGVFNAFSAELAGIRRDGNAVTDSVMTGVALVDTPAFHDARVVDVHAQHTTTGEPTMNVADFIRAMLGAGASMAEARAKAVEHFGQAAVDAVSDDDVDYTPVTPDAQTPPPATPAEVTPAPVAAQAGYTPPRAAVVPAGAPGVPTAPLHLSAHEAAETVARMVSGRRGDVAHAELADITASAMVDATPPQWLGELWEGPAQTRRLIPLMNRRDLRSWRIQGFAWKEKPLVAEYAGDKAEIPTGPVSIQPYESEATRWAGGHDLDRKFFDFGDAGILESYWRAMNESYAVVTDNAAAAWLVANAKAAGSATDLTRAMITASTAVDDALHVMPSYYLANPTDRLALLSITRNDLPAYLDLFGVDPRAIVWTNRVPAGTLIAGAKPAATFYELPGSPLRVEAEHLSHGGRDRAMFGYTALTLDNAAGLVKVTIAAGGGA